MNLPRTRESRAIQKAPAPLFAEGARRRYLSAGLKQVEGWLDPLSARFIAEIDRIQQELGIRGGVGEIGVHHGKLFILLHLMLREGERSFALDVFEQQELNTDRSGRGDREQFLHNVVRWAGRAELVDIFADSSENVSAEEIVARTGRVRIFSVDGGHTEKLTMNDLGIAERALSPGGVVIMDDYFNAHWPDVSCGVGRYFRESGTRLRPILICPNKLLLCEAPYAAAYQDAFQQRFRYAYLKRTVMFGASVLIFDSLDHLPHRWERRRMRIGDRLRGTVAFAVYRKLASTPAGRALGPLVRRLFP